MLLLVYECFLWFIVHFAQHAISLSIHKVQGTVNCDYYAVWVYKREPNPNFIVCEKQLIYQLQINCLQQNPVEIDCVYANVFHPLMKGYIPKPNIVYMKQEKGTMCEAITTPKKVTQSTVVTPPPSVKTSKKPVTTTTEIFVPPVSPPENIPLITRPVDETPENVPVQTGNYTECYLEKPCPYMPDAACMEDCGDIFVSRREGNTLKNLRTVDWKEWSNYGVSIGELPNGIAIDKKNPKICVTLKIKQHLECRIGSVRIIVVEDIGSLFFEQNSQQQQQKGKTRYRKRVKRSISCCKTCGKKKSGHVSGYNFDFNVTPENPFKFSKPNPYIIPTTTTSSKEECTPQKLLQWNERPDIMTFRFIDVKYQASESILYSEARKTFYVHRFNSNHTFHSAVPARGVEVCPLEWNDSYRMWFEILKCECKRIERPTKNK